MIQELTIKITNRDNVGTVTHEQAKVIQEIITALIQSGGLTGVKGGKTIIHFNGDGVFQGVELDYWPWRRRSQ